MTPRDDLDNGLVLASASPYRRAMLENAGVSFVSLAPEIDERAVEEAMRDSGTTPSDLALVLATAKAEDVSSRTRGRLIIGSDQVLSLEGEVLHKAADMEEARRKLLRLSGRTHRLDTAVVLVRDDELLWSHVSPVTLTMRALSAAQVGRYLATVGDAALSSVGAYQIEGVGISLFEKMEGDFFSIVGLPLLPLLAALRQHGALDD